MKSQKQKSAGTKNRSFKATESYTAEETYPKISVIWRFSSCFMPWEYNRIPESQNAQAVFLPARFWGSYFAMGTPSAGLAVGVVHRAERLAGGVGGVSGLAFCLAMCYISKPKPRNNLYTKNMLIWTLYHRKYFLSIWVQNNAMIFVVLAKVNIEFELQNTNYFRT